MNKKKLYEQIMKEMSVKVKNALNEEFEAPKKTAIEKFFGMAKTYAKRVAKAENEYYEKNRADFVALLQKSTSMSDLLIVSKKMLGYGYKFPISGMLADGIIPAKADLEKINWMSYDREFTYTAAELAKIEKKTDSVVDLDVYTYYYSWRWWVANILRCLFFWKEPYGKEASEGIGELIKKYAPKCPIIELYPSYFKKNS